MSHVATMKTTIQPSKHPNRSPEDTEGHRGPQRNNQGVKFLRPKGAKIYQPGASPQVRMMRKEGALKGRPYLDPQTILSPIQGSHLTNNHIPGAMPQAGISLRRWRAAAMEQRFGFLRRWRAVTTYAKVFSFAVFSRSFPFLPLSLNPPT